MDSLLTLFYYFDGAFPIDELIDYIKQINLKKKQFYNNMKNKFGYSINFYESQFQLDTSLNGKEILFLDINKFIIDYDSNENETPYGTYKILLNQLYANIDSNNYIRKLFSTDNDFLSITINYNEAIFSSNIIMNILKINLSYSDLISFLRVYLLNKKMISNANKKKEDYKKNLETIIIQKEKENTFYKTKDMESQKNDLLNIIYKKAEKIVFTGEAKFKKLDITLIDDSKESYHPFMNIINEEINIFLEPDKTIESSFWLNLYSYNYISCVWEPTIEKTQIKYNELHQKEKGSKITKGLLNIDKLLINLSDMAISFTLLTFSNWINKLEEKKKLFEQENENLSENTIQIKTETGNKEQKKLSKITNNQVINYSGVDLTIIHNEKQIKIPPLYKIELEYVNDFNDTNKSKYIILI